MVQISQLEFKHITNYLAYNLMCQVITPEVTYNTPRVIVGRRNIDNSRGWRSDILLLESIPFSHRKNMVAPVKYCKPYLRSMEDIDKPLTHPEINDGKEFIPKQYLQDNFKDMAIGDVVSFCNYGMKGISSEVWYSEIVEVIDFLDKLHFDYRYDLIGQKLAHRIEY